METEYPTLRRPKRKLCYITDKESPPKHWEGTLTLKDVDRMFDDLDSASHANLQPPSPLLQTSDSEINQNEREGSPAVPQEGQLIEKLQGYEIGKGPEGDVLHPSSPKVDIDLDIPFKAHGPVKTSSPIIQNMAVEEEEKQDNEKEQVVSPILFGFEDVGLEEPKKDLLPTQSPQRNEHISEENDDSALESPPSKIALTKMSGYKEKTESRGSQESAQPPVHTVSQEPEVAAPELSTHVGKDMTGFLKKLKDAGLSKASSSQESAQPPVQTVSHEPEVAVAEVSTRVGKDLTAFLQKLKDAGQSKVSCSRKTTVKVPTPPEPEDDFMILEDDTPLCFSIPSKRSSSKKQRHSKTSSTDKDSSEDKRTKDRPLETPGQQQESEKTKDKLEGQAVDRKIKKTEKEKNSEMTGPRNDDDDDKLPSPHHAPAGGLLGREEPKKKKQQLKKASSRERDEAEGQPRGRARRKIEKEKPKKTETKASKSAETKKPKSSKDVKENAKTHRANSLKTTRKGLQEADAVKDADEQSCNKCGDTEDFGPTVDKETVNCEANGKAKQNNRPVVSEGSSSEDCQVLGKRKRKPTGAWWLSCPGSTEETHNDQQSTQKKSKQKPEEPSAGVSSPAKAKKEKVSKKRNQKRLEVLPGQQTSKAGKRKTKQSKKGNKRGDTMKETNEEFMAAVPEQSEQQEVPDHDPDQEECSPLMFTQRDLSLNSGGRIFQRVYHHNSNEKLSVTPEAPVSQRQPKEQLTEANPAKRRRRVPGNWWVANSMDADLENRSSQPQQLHPKGPKPNKERKKPSKQSRSPRLGVPKNGNAAVLLKPLGGAPVPPLKPKSLLTPKTVKRSLATFKDIFTSVTESPTVVSSRGRRQTNRCNVTPRPDEKICVAYSNTDTAHSSPDNQEASQDSRSQVFRSGPSSMIELEDYEDNDGIILPSTRSPALLSASDFCAPPLKPLILQRKDKANLTEWFKSLWPTTSDSDPGVTPEQFDWYFYQDRALGLQVDLSSDSFCSGKMLLGSLMKMPLRVDHSATTVFNLLTSSVNVIIDGCESRFSPGTSFVVEYGHAYIIQNLTAQPAVLCFTRMFADAL
ncbi:uncharacterized protein LOC115799515 isoform X1 [Archocentrus centrarchus]|uniref:uncharacterized protein LOC115799515 isoform X1 n=1 Tax=Archocentrus centrarchus TaxID=63155 RepID=UPI0011EA181A|nr:uncharacterized protein LOC115799515 isoform X1 [Archocentrus centrarchus]